MELVMTRVFNYLGKAYEINKENPNAGKHHEVCMLPQHWQNTLFHCPGDEWLLFTASQYLLKMHRSCYISRLSFTVMAAPIHQFALS